MRLCVVTAVRGDGCAWRRLCLNDGTQEEWRRMLRRRRSGGGGEVEEEKRRRGEAGGPPMRAEQV